MSTTKELKPKPVLFHISHSLFNNKRLKRRLAGGIQKKLTKKRPKNKTQPHANGQTLNYLPPPSETIEISTDEEDEPTKRPQLQQQPEKPYEPEASIVLSSDEEDETATRTRLFPMLSSETTVQTAIGNTVYELSLTQLKENLESIEQKRPVKKKKKKSNGTLGKRLSNALSPDVSISLVSDDEDGTHHIAEAHTLL